jgi:serine/threonine protein kinase
MAAFQLDIPPDTTKDVAVSTKGLNDTFCSQCVNPGINELRRMFTSAGIPCIHISDAVFTLLSEKYIPPPTSPLKLLKKVNEGNYGAVYTSMLNGESVAVKVVNYREHQSIQILVELSIMAKLTSSVLVACKGFYFKSDKLHIVMEYLEGEDLYKVFEDSIKQPLSLSMVCTLLLDVAHGLQLLHSQTPPIVHRDIKLENVLVDVGHAAESAAAAVVSMRAKIADFGSSTFYLDDEDYRIKETVLTVGTAAYLPPRDKDVSPALDMYAFGVLCLMMVSTRTVSKLSNEQFEELQTDFNLRDKTKLLEFVQSNMNQKDYKIERLMEEVRKCLNADAALRPSASTMAGVLENCISLIRTLKRKEPDSAAAEDMPTHAIETGLMGQRKAFASLEQGV